jgi:hypothetical protein
VTRSHRRDDGVAALATFAYLIVTPWANRRRPTPVATWSGMAGLGKVALAQDVEHFATCGR